ncbi:winged helix-turn-helix transcriptional regulator [Sulfitobacter mediterraneus]|uniref:ArsR/SmtB family transcription factor n=1 Tax=Sulfitobacter mediterraneus TaxID=83219 RepID=UPI0019346423|nr:metalloregulator ArsR/SmtB family transcription factor [Sulfitobacter mediterraneus]MBM1308736.1 winged helix-turn-helix transcriptional regulator [Sulfitobacter mediterraneus]MBM1312621.1 winged helix-turn-helix transcriptional regulator [Sulfitobacter mediterraneus]MBM1321002.1 winged helix-turn-helix transcriptional regulator [Sulfitobacter mediterraneus]MBM1324890.1 winged helix-turn-helix transcriptional regulator [Sulfitobacter mediterraneus]MBM1396236.1 winged helix-turn-helix transc
MNNMTRTFAALADPTRLTVVEELMQRGEMPAGDLVSHVGMSPPAVSRHLKVLREAGVVTQRADGTKRYYRVAPESMRAIVDWTIAHRSFWEASLDRLDAILAEEGGAHNE